ncbi:MAG: hypothetical protein ACREA9_11365 [Pyrinomonadaceae bacterium]
MPALLARSGAGSSGETPVKGLGYQNFEGPQVHPLALTPDGKRLLALNTPNNQLLVFTLNDGIPTLRAEIPVGLEPVSVAVRDDHEAWVANWVSDSITVVNLNNYVVARTFDVGDEPTDIVFTGTSREQAFVCVSGLNQVKIYDARAPEALPQILDIPGKRPRSLARDPEGRRVFVSVFESGNETTVVPRLRVNENGGLPPPNPPMTGGLPRAPTTGLIVKFNGNDWLDERGTVSWNSQIKFRLADVDVAVIDAAGTKPTVSREVCHVGTLIGNADFDASTQRLLVANTESTNQIRFEPILKGRFAQTRLAAIELGETAPKITSWDLNAHVKEGESGTDEERALSLALPADLKVSADGTAYVAATGSGKVGIVDRQGRVIGRIKVGEGPTGLALNEQQKRLYVLNRFEESLSIVDTTSRLELKRLQLGFNPEPTEVRSGRKFLYDASLSAHGDLACATCHFNAERDGLAWDLGDPQGKFVSVKASSVFGFHPMKGPMITQSLRGTIGTEPLHWRGDRPQLEDFNPAFISLLGSPRQLTEAEMTQLKAFMASLTYPPNPRQNLDRTYASPESGPSAARGEKIFLTAITDQKTLSCAKCHSASNGTGTNKDIIPGVVRQEAQAFKVPQLRGIYQKLGRVDAPGKQLSGFGFLHDGAEDTIFHFLQRRIFSLTDDQRADLEEFVLSFDTGTAPAVGLQETVDLANRFSDRTTRRINLLMAQAEPGNCDLVVTGFYRKRWRGFLFLGKNSFKSDREKEPKATLEAILGSLEPGEELTFMGVFRGTGSRLSIDCDGDGTLNGDAPPKSRCQAKAP